MALFWRNTDYDGNTVQGAVISVSSNDFQQLAPSNTWGICNIQNQGQCSFGAMTPDVLYTICESGLPQLPTYPVYIWKSWDEQREYDLTQTGNLSEKIVFENSHEIHKIVMNDDLCTIKSTQYMTAGTINKLQDAGQELLLTYIGPVVGIMFAVFSSIIVYAQIRRALSRHM